MIRKDFLEQGRQNKDIEIKKIMTDTQILEAVIKKAVKSGWLDNVKYEEVNVRVKKQLCFNEYTIEIKTESQEYYYTNVCIEYIIFDPEFAKAFAKHILNDNYLLLELFGDSKVIDKYDKARILEQATAEEFLQQLAISENRIQYLKQFI